MDDSDPISDSTPNKRRKLNNEWDSSEDSGEEFTVEDFEPSATLPLTNYRRPQPQLHEDLKPSNIRSSPPRTFITQPTQTLPAVTQPTQPLPPRQNGSGNGYNDIEVERSSPVTMSSPKPLPPPIRKAPFAKPLAKSQGLLASAMAPPGTAFRQPLGIQSKPSQPLETISLDSDEEDPPVHHSSDEETQGLSSNLKPTIFKKGGRGLDSTPNRVKESPKVSGFSNLMSEFGFTSSSNRSDDMASAYGSTSRAPRPPPAQRAPSRAMPVLARRKFEKLEDVPELAMRDKIRKIQETIEFETVQRCYDALIRSKGNVNDALSWLFEDEEQDAPGEDDDEVDELAGNTPVAKRGVAVSAYSQSSQSVRPPAKQEVKAPTLTIAEKYGSTQAARKPSLTSPDDEVVRPRRRLQQGRKTRSPTPPSSPVQKPPQPLQRLKRPAEVLAIDDDDGDVSEEDTSLGEEVVPESHHDQRLLNFFNTCSVQDLTDLSTQPEDVVKFVLDRRPFQSLDAIRVVSNITETRSGKKSRSRPVGDKIVDICSDVFTGYDAIDELVDECERISKPIQNALKGWGVGSAEDGELHLLNLDDAHDSGIGTPSSTSDDIPMPSGSKHKGRFLGQPDSMNSEATLKDYQLVGLNWLNLLYSKKLSCILADEMGLGKTCQVIAFLAHLKQQHIDGPHLVIVPGSTLENWLREFKFFAPMLEVR